MRAGNVSGRASSREIVVPCFNEGRRIDEGAFLDLVAGEDVRLRFVDDGSTDNTADVLDRLCSKSSSIDVVHLPHNGGKGEAVRQGLRLALPSGATTVGYLDADLSTPGHELVRLIEILESRPELQAVFGSRVARLGSHIQRSPVRHYSGRVFASAASVALGAAVYDTQCGAKVFRSTDSLAAALQTPFRSRWAFDVELCQRLFDGDRDVPGVPVAAFLEVPLEEWRDKPGSKVSLVAGAGALLDVFQMALVRRKRTRDRRP
jgi:dolichyl-phosphate beta-glucosyltransferase